MRRYLRKFVSVSVSFLRFDAGVRNRTDVLNRRGSFKPYAAVGERNTRTDAFEAKIRGRNGNGVYPSCGPSTNDRRSGRGRRISAKNAGNPSVPGTAADRDPG